LLDIGVEQQIHGSEEGSPGRACVQTSLKRNCDPGNVVRLGPPRAVDRGFAGGKGFYGAPLSVFIPDLL
jgi:hypothetical protein